MNKIFIREVIFYMCRKKSVKFTAIFLILALLFVSIISCQSNDGGNTPNAENPAKETSVPDSATEPDEQTAELKDKLPDDLDFDGATVNIVQRTFDLSWPCCSEFICETENGDIFNDTIYRRNMAVEERLNVTLNFISEDAYSLPAKVRANILAVDNTYDLVAGMCGNIGPLATEGLFMNLKDVPHIDFMRPWWNQQIVNGATVGDKLYLLAGDANLSVLMYCMLLFVNKQLMAEYELPDIYDAVIDGKWTIDYMSSYIKGISKDLNGDGVMDKNDLYGFVSPKHEIFLSPFMEAGGIQVTKINIDGVPYLDMTIERMAGLADKFCALVYNNPNTFLLNTFGDGTDQEMFRNNQALFLPYAMQDAVYWKDMKSDFGMVPFPKYDEAQENYYSRVLQSYTLFSIPFNSATSEMTGAVMEAMSSESYRTATPTYFDIVLKIKNTRDEQTEKMVDIIRDSAYIDFSTIFNDQINNPWGTLYSSTQNGNNTFASWYEKTSREHSSL